LPRSFSFIRGPTLPPFENENTPAHPPVSLPSYFSPLLFQNLSSLSQWLGTLDGAVIVHDEASDKVGHESYGGKHVKVGISGSLKRGSQSALMPTRKLGEDFPRPGARSDLQRSDLQRSNLQRSDTLPKADFDHAASSEERIVFAEQGGESSGNIDDGPRGSYGQRTRAINTNALHAEAPSPFRTAVSEDEGTKWYSERSLGRSDSRSRFEDL